MPLRPFSRAQTFLFPPHLDELIGPDHPARFVAAFVETLDRAAWQRLGIAPDGEHFGAAAYAPPILLNVWLYGFLCGVRSSRKLETACREQFAFAWLTGWQHPDHNTLWRFYQAHRAALRGLLRESIQVAVRAQLVDLAVQAIDGTKLAGNAAKDRTLDAAGLDRLLERTEQAILDLEAQNETSGDPPPPRLPPALQTQQRLRDRIGAARAQLAQPGGPQRINLTDPEAVLLKGRHGYVAGYNAQAVVAPLDPMQAGRRGHLLTAAEVTTQVHDQEQLVPMIAAAAENLGLAPDQPRPFTLADGGYHAGAVLAACAAQGLVVAMPESGRAKTSSAPTGAVPKPAVLPQEAFTYEARTDSYTCPAGQTLRFQGLKTHRGHPPSRVYRSQPAVCRVCPLVGRCTQSERHGRVLEISPYQEQLRAHRAWMQTEPARTQYARRQGLIEGRFGQIKEHQGGRRLLLRGLVAVQAEWSLLATAFNLKTLWQIWRQRPPQERAALLAPS
jgi:transposase